MRAAGQLLLATLQLLPPAVRYEPGKPWPVLLSAALAQLEAALGQSHSSPFVVIS